MMRITKIEGSSYNTSVKAVSDTCKLHILTCCKKDSSGNDPYVKVEINEVKFTGKDMNASAEKIAITLRAMADEIVATTAKAQKLVKEYHK